MPIYRKGDKQECGNCRTIALISHPSEVLLRIIQMREALEEWESEIRVGGRMVTNLGYTDDTTLHAGTKEDLI